MHVQRLKHGLSHALSVSLGGFRRASVSKTGFLRRNPEFVVERVMQDFLCVVPIRDDTVHDKGAQYFYPALRWRLRNRGGRGRPRRSTTGVYSEVATPRMEATHLSKDTSMAKNSSPSTAPKSGAQLQTTWRSAKNAAFHGEKEINRQAATHTAIKLMIK